MDRYSKINNKMKREIVLLKGAPCRYGACSFCDYIEDNSNDSKANHELNAKVLTNVTGEFGILEVINSGNIFELPKETRVLIKEIIQEKGIHTMCAEAHWIYRSRVQEIRDYFGIKMIIKTGLETFDEDFRENVLNKGFGKVTLEDLKSYCDSVCLMVGIQGQTKEMIVSDIEMAMVNFDHFTVNVYVNNTTDIKADEALIEWFSGEYRWLDDEPKCDVLWVNTDFGVGD